MSDFVKEGKGQQLYHRMDPHDSLGPGGGLTQILRSKCGSV
jgi:hypothetical protein